MMRYCLICGECLNTHAVNRTTCKKPTCVAKRRQETSSFAMDVARKRSKLRKLVNRNYNPKVEAA